MAATLSKQTLGILLSLFVLVVVLGVNAYFFFVLAAAETVEPVPGDYPVSVISGEMRNTAGVFDRTRPLLDGAAPSSPSAVPNLSGELGKTDITKYE